MLSRTKIVSPSLKAVSHLATLAATCCLVCQPLAAESPIHAALEPFVESHTLAGAVTLVASPDKILEVDCIGYANIESKKPMTEDTLFWIASMSKPVVGVAVMILVDEGKLDLDKPIEHYLPEFNNQWLIAEQDGDHMLLKKNPTRITLRHLMSHTSGLPFTSVIEQPTLDQLRLKDTVRGYSMIPLKTEPGTKYSYSNAGVNTAGRIIEVVSGMSFEAFLDKRIFEPLGMTDTTFWPNEAQVARLATVYGPNADKTNLQATTISQLTYPLSDRTRQPMPGGGLFSTADDMAKFGQMVLNLGRYDIDKPGEKRLLSEAAVKEMTKKQTSASLSESYGVGWAGNSESSGHGGALSTNLNVNFKDKLVTVYLVQHAGYGGTDGDSIQPAFQKAARKIASGN